MPRYINLAGELIVPPPYRHTGATQHGFLFEADEGVLQSLIDRTLNRIPGMQFEVVSGHVLLIALYVESVTSIAPGYEDRGVGSETDIGFWVQVRGGRTGQAQRRLWFPVYLFVDSAGAMVIGREVYGYPKHMGRPERTAPDNPNDVRFELSTDFFEEYGPTETPVSTQLFEIAREEGAPAPVALGGSTLPQLAAAYNLAAAAIGADDFGLPYLAMPMVFVKQFRAIENGLDACYIAATTVAVMSTQIMSTAIIFDRLKINITPSANFDIAGDLGIQSGAPSLLTMRLRHNFDVGFGSTL